MVFISQDQILAKDLPVLILSAFVASALILLLVFSVILWGLTRQVALLYYIVMLLSYVYILATVYGWMQLWDLPSDPWILIAQPVLILSFLLLTNAILAINQTYNKLYQVLLAIGSAAGRNLADDLNDLAKQNVAPHIIRQMQQDLHTQQRARQRLQDLVSQCLEADYEVNRFEKGYTTLAKFSQILYQSLNKIEQRPRIIMEWDFKPEQLSEQHSTLRIKGDAEPLVMALNMVVNNALKYSKPDQNVIISVSLDNAQLIIAVRDFGIGFDQDKEITQAFKRGRNTQSTSGLGLGLYISQDILQRYHGSLTIETQQPGSLVSLSIPLSIPLDSK